MAEYDQALDCQADWVSFWTSTAGRNLFHGLQGAIANQRRAKGEKGFEVLSTSGQEYGMFMTLITPLLNGECYYWAPDILEMIKVASSSLPDTSSLMKQHIPAASGFFWFAKELEGGVRGVAWTVCSADRKKNLLTGV